MHEEDTQAQARVWTCDVCGSQTFLLIEGGACECSCCGDVDERMMAQEVERVTLH